jgi:putative two-component system response regulator
MLVFAQAACLALGLWLEYRFVLSISPKSGSGLAAAHHSEASDMPSVFAMRSMAFVWIVALQAVVAYLILSRAQEATHRKQSRTERVSIERYNDLLRTRDAVIFGLAKLAESRDGDTGNHLERIAIYSTRLASALRRNPQYRRQITPQFLKLIGISASLHDIGKVGISDSILLKPGKFESHERHAMNMHAAIGGKCIRDIESRLGKSNFLQMAREIAFAHHERWDGTGYPRGLAGEEIPLAARIVALADVYDALTSKRVYKEAIPHARCVAMIKEGRGTQFDPGIVAAFLEIEQEFYDIAVRYTEPQESGENEQRFSICNLENELAS